MLTGVVPHAGTWIEIVKDCILLCHSIVVPHAGTWIEITGHGILYSVYCVVPHAGTWIEISFISPLNFAS